MELAIALAPDAWPAFGDAGQLENAVLNLAINARDAMPSGGKLTIETANTHLDIGYASRHEDLKPGDYTVLSVSDTGVGMTAEVIAKAFDPFFTTKPIGQGTGLGLSMIYGFARQSGGHARIYSEVGQGSTVRLYLPRFIGEAQVDDENQLRPDLPRGAGKPSWWWRTMRRSGCWWWRCCQSSATRPSRPMTARPPCRSCSRTSGSTCWSLMSGCRG
uniref:histidine kinase n=1 Tax=Phenylobacterium glaciei TaxID=2803784 RepID=A0A974S8C4_9CAUL|nr:hypothetical protein JKL49_00350 [Phenylobacterium glaciei]